jgi:hypothetical protein
MSGRHGKPPSGAEAGMPLNRMITCIHTGQVGRFLAFDQNGELLNIAGHQ